MEKIPTAEEFFNSHYGAILRSDTQSIQLMRDFAKLHVKAALETALEEVPYGSSTDTTSYEDVKGILTCYPLENIQ